MYAVGVGVAWDSPLENRTFGRWPGRHVPFEINSDVFPIGSAAVTAINQAISAWNLTGVITMTPRRTDETAFILFGPDQNSCNAGVGFNRGIRTISCALVTDPVGAAATAHEVAIIPQTDDVLTVAMLDGTGFVNIGWMDSEGFWRIPKDIGGASGVANGRVTMAKQTDDIVVAAFVSNDGVFTSGVCPREPEPGRPRRSTARR